MSESKTPAHWPPDSDLNAKTVAFIGIGLVLATAVAAVLMWWLSIFLRERQVEKDPPPPVLIEAQSPYTPPSPRLSPLILGEIEPELQLKELRAQEEAVLGSYAWTNEANGIARVPIERGMELLIETRPGAEAFGDAAAPEAVDSPAADRGDTQ